jgi:hypothetical protein
MGWTARLAAAALAMGLVLAPAIAGARGAADFGAEQPSADARLMAQWVIDSRDHRGKPFAIVDKKNAQIYVFNEGGRLTGASPVLLGQTVGDESAPDVGAHTDEGRVPLAERTTPAGRFVSEPGRNLHGEHVVWVDYESAFAIHRLRPGASRRDREARIASANASDKRASLGCVVVPETFYDRVVMQELGRGRAMVYVLPETRSMRDLLSAMQS